MLKIETFAILVLLQLMQNATCQSTLTDSCYQFQSKLCVRCKQKTHLYNGICYQNILGCIQYKQGHKCIKCQPGNFQLFNSGCKIAKKSLSVKQFLSNLDKYSGNKNSSFADQYGESDFNPVRFNIIKNEPTFIALDASIRSKDYSHFISRTKNPIYSVSYYQRNGTYSYKILYEGSGGGLFLCIADVLPQFRINLRSLTPISASNVISNCTGYDTNGKCLICGDGNHLQSGKCYANYGGCLRYYQNICIQCLDYFLLIQNRCVADCLSISDTRSILYYDQNKNGVSSLDIYHGFSTLNFYKSNINTQQVFTTRNITKMEYIKPISYIQKTTKTVQIATRRIISGNTLNNVNLPSQKLPKHLPPFKTLLNSQKKQNIQNINNCIKFLGRKCSKCIKQHFVNEFGVCEQLGPLCISFNQQNGKCTKCFQNYILFNGRCIVKQ